MIEKLIEQRYTIAVYLLIVPTLMRLLDRCFGDILSENGLLTIWGLVAAAFMATDVFLKAAEAKTKAGGE